MKKKKHKWKYIDDLKVYYIYRKNKNNYRIEAEIDNDLQEIPISSIGMKISNYDFLHTGTGLYHCSKQSEDIYREFKKVILTTHSPTTVALAPEDSVFVMKKETNSTSIKKSNRRKALNTLTEGYATLETGIELLSSEKKLMIITEGKNIEYIKKATTLFEKSLKEKIHIVSELKNKSGKDQLKIYSDFLLQLPLKNKYLFVLDCDVDISKFQNNDKVEIFKFDRQKSKVSKGIENLFPEELLSEGFYNKKPKPDGGTFTELNKDKFKNHILEYGTKEDFTNFKPLIDKIKKPIISGINIRNILQK